MNRIAASISCLTIALACARGAVAVRGEVSRDFEVEYGRIVKMIDYYSNAHKLPASRRPPPAEQSLDINSRILKTDRNP